MNIARTQHRRHRKMDRMVNVEQLRRYSTRDPSVLELGMLSIGRQLRQHSEELPENQEIKLLEDNSGSESSGDIVNGDNTHEVLNEGAEVFREARQQPPRTHRLPSHLKDYKI